MSEFVRVASVSEVPDPGKAVFEVDERLMMEGEDLCRHFLDFTATLQMGGGWEGVYTWPSLMPDESPGSYAAAAGGFTTILAMPNTKPSACTLRVASSIRASAKSGPRWRRSASAAYSRSSAG